MTSGQLESCGKPNAINLPSKDAKHANHKNIMNWGWFTVGLPKNRLNLCLFSLKYELVNIFVVILKPKNMTWSIYVNMIYDLLKSAQEY